jgi:hypothetical protein
VATFYSDAFTLGERTTGGMLLIVPRDGTEIPRILARHAGTRTSKSSGRSIAMKARPR